MLPTVSSWHLGNWDLETATYLAENSQSLKFFLRDLQPCPLTSKVYGKSGEHPIFFPLQDWVSCSRSLHCVYMAKRLCPKPGSPPLFLSIVIPHSLVLCFYLPWLKALALNGLSQCPSLMPSFLNFSLPGTSQESWRVLFSRRYDYHTIWFILNVYKNERWSLSFNLWCTQVGVPRVACHRAL